MSLEVQWTDTDPATGLRRFVSVEKFAGRWQFKVRSKRRENWDKTVPVTKAMWEDLLEALERRVQRNEGATEIDVESVRRQVAKYSE